MTQSPLSSVKFRPLAGLSGPGRSTRVFLTRQLWVWPLLATLLLGIIGWWVNRRVEGAMREQLADELTTLLNADEAALRLWLKETQADSEALALDVTVRTATRELLALADAAPKPEAALLP